MTKLKEVVVIDAVRSAIGKSGRDGMKKNGQLCQASSQDLLAAVMRGLLDRVKKRAPSFDEREIEDVIVGCLSQIGDQGANIARVASFLAGIPEEACGCTVNQYCNAGLKAINMATQALRCGDGEIILCAGIEIMSHYFMGSDLQVAMMANLPMRFTKRVDEAGLTIPQGLCSEMISREAGHTREDLDRFGMMSMQNAVKAHREGWHDDHIIPFEYEWNNERRVVEKDEVLRFSAVDDPESYWKNLQNLRPIFQPDGGIVTAGNSSQIVDGCAATLLMTADKAEELGLEPICKITGTAVAGGAAVPMLLAPIPAVYKALKRAGNKTMDDMDIIEPNEAFATPCLSFADEFKYAYDDPRVNPTGGAIALGHPIGASGVIWFGEMVHHLRRTRARAGIQMMCGGGGLGIATVIEAV